MNQPNLLILIADGMQAETVSPTHPCRTPTLEALARRGVSFSQAHTTCPTCSPARASLMTGLLPHNHGVLEVEHGRDPDQCVLRTEFPHFAQRLSVAGYHTGYFGKWHIERTNDVSRFGWRENAVKGADHLKGLGRGDAGPQPFALDEDLCGYVEGPRGYNRLLHWGVTDTPLDRRYPGLTVLDAEEFLQRRLGQAEPWCCCVSFSEPNEALIVGRETWNDYDPDAIPLPENFFDDLSDRPNLYQREQEIGRRLTETHWRAARACYFGRITELDGLIQRLISKIDRAGRLDDTLVVFLADHGRYVGAHGFDAHNFGAFEEIYRIPVIVAGPGVAAGTTSAGRVSIADLGATICELGGGEPLSGNDAQSFARLLSQSEAISPEFESGYAEYHGTRFPLMQRILWRGAWKFVFNGFDFDELYNLEEDPHEMTNLVRDPAQQDRVESMMAEIWTRVRQTGDRAIAESHYFSLRLGCVGPEAGVR
jgi:arylsulfatase A-like enzyme